MNPDTRYSMLKRPEKINPKLSDNMLQVVSEFITDNMNDLCQMQDDEDYEKLLSRCAVTVLAANRAERENERCEWTDYKEGSEVSDPTYKPSCCEYRLCDEGPFCPNCGKRIQLKGEQS